LPQIIHVSALTLFNIGIVLCIQNAITVRSRVLNNPMLVWIGSLSYSLYLWQMLFANPDVQSWATTFPQNFVLTLLAAVVSFYAIERPVLRLRERRAKKTRPPVRLAPSFEAAGELVEAE
jgi:peptidoglycan/LPS O-acetylase OafA/YrhL